MLPPYRLNWNRTLSLLTASEPMMSDDELFIVYESVPVRGNTPQSSDKNSKEIKRDPEDFSKCCFCNKPMSCIVEYITHTAGCPENKTGIVGKATENPAENNATDSPGRSISDGDSDMVLLPSLSPVEDSGVSLSPGEVSRRSVSPGEVSSRSVSPDEVLARSFSPGEVSGRSVSPDEVSGRSFPPSEVSGRSISPDEVSGRSFSPSEVSGRSISPDEVSGRSFPPSEVSGRSVSPDEVSGQSLSLSGVSVRSFSPSEVSVRSPLPCEVSKPVWFSDNKPPATVTGYTTGDGCTGERNQDSSRCAKYFTQSDAAIESLPSPPPDDVSPQVSRLTFHSGCVTDACYRKPSTAIMIIADCVAVKPARGLATELIHKYPYSNVYASRRPISSLNRACVQDRPNPGTYTISRSSSNAQDPAIITVFGQFYIGAGFENNRFSQKLVHDMKARAGYWLDPYTPTVDPRYCDMNLLTGLQWDMQENRVYWFRQALEELAGVLREKGIDRVVIPYGIGCGPAGGNWLQEYLVAIESFEAQVRRHGVEIVIVTKIEDKKPVASIRRDAFYQNKCRPHRNANKPYSRNVT